MHGQAYLTSAKIAAEMGPFAGYPPNRDAFLEVISMHRDAAYAVEKSGVPKDLHEAQRAVWDLTLESGRQHGFRNAQATVLAPTGTIGFMMDCDTTGVEPDLALVKYKKLVGGGTIKIVNQTVPHALTRLGYSDAEMHAIVSYIDEKGTIEGAPSLKSEHLPVFDCAFKALGGTRSIAPMGHVRMMSAVQPFLSGAISKTVNMPNDATVEEIADVYMQGWKLGLKAIAIYRDGCKRTQPLNTAASKNDDAVKGHRGLRASAAGAGAPAAAPAASAAPDGTPRRHKLPDERRAITHKFSVAGHEGYITVGLYEDGTPGEIFLTMAKEGSTISGLMDSFATAISLTLQYGVPLEALVEKFSHMRFEPSGYTKNPEIPIAKSLVDYLFRWLASKFLTADLKEKAGVISREERGPADDPGRPQEPSHADACRGEHRGPCPRGRRGLPGARERKAAGPRGGRAAGHRVRRSGARARGQAPVREQRRRTELPRVRQPHGAQRRLLQVPELRSDERLQLRWPVGDRRPSRGCLSAFRRADRKPSGHDPGSRPLLSPLSRATPSARRTCTCSPSISPPPGRECPSGTASARRRRRSGIARTRGAPRRTSCRRSRA